ncbi:prolipoprotein diacylglyceryl transferase [Thermomonospora umbrina]|nr:prolipoprotein diacylglyceryl transferase [Thermomonospora umbrina]
MQPLPLATIPSPDQGVWHVGPFPLRAYALMIILGIVVAVWLGERRWTARGGTPGAVIDVAVWAVPFGLVGGRLYHVVTDWQRYFGEDGDPGRALQIWEGGLGIWGAVLLGALGAYIGCRRRGISVLAMGDAVAPGIALAQAIGRWGNWWNQELYGRPLDTWWALEIDPDHRPKIPGTDVTDPRYADVASYHPTFLYESLWCVALAIVVIWAGRRYRLTHGRTFALYVAGYTVGRFWIEWLRIDEAHMITGLRLNVWTALIVFAGAVAYLYLARNRTTPETVTIKGTETDPSAPALPPETTAPDHPPAPTPTSDEPAPSVDVVNKATPPAEPVDEPEAPVDVADEAEPPADMADEPESSVDGAGEPALPVDVVDEPEAPVDVVDDSESSVEVADEPEPSADVVDEPESSVDGAGEPALPVDVVDEPEAPVDVADESESSVEVADEPEPSADVVDAPEAPVDVVDEPESMVDGAGEPALPVDVVDEPEALVDVVDDSVPPVDGAGEPEASAEAQREPVPPVEVVDESEAVDEPESTVGVVEGSERGSAAEEPADGPEAEPLAVRESEDASGDPEGASAAEPESDTEPEGRPGAEDAFEEPEVEAEAEPVADGGGESEVGDGGTAGAEGEGDRAERGGERAGGGREAESVKDSG